MKPLVLRDTVFPNRVMVASGTFGYGLEFNDYFPVSRLGGISVKGLSLSGSQGNAMPRIAETYGGMLNAIGLQNIGVQSFVTEKLPQLREIGATVIANFYGNTVDEYVACAQALSVDGIHALEMNISCPNVKSGGIAFGSDVEMTRSVVQAVRESTDKPLIVKLSPNVADIRPFAEASVNSGADSLSLINTLIGMAIDIKTRKPRIANLTGGLSGPAIKPVGIRMVYQVCQVTDVPVIGIGGVMNRDDALEYFLAGASAVQVGTANFINPAASLQILEELESFFVNNAIDFDQYRGGVII
ncbi:dihydroorotate dehydrogenase [Desulfurispira natronophila]|uniref:Dihydroorotate dehydrogenase n=1 Tax=Desulfurispira natronophila TaxID=682562 RepID=A0A7W7Y636_9BACT|nr:dihydroorotate dehydrogenase [Desulfurispira natronophila]MBB5022614.1 dihydroorotate dehydrogenase (NAD+) catalytic subunit [Desulfurispira natronophila]